MAPRARFELATLRLTAECSTVELPGIRRTHWFHSNTAKRIKPLRGPAYVQLNLSAILISTRIFLRVYIRNLNCVWRVLDAKSRRGDKIQLSQRSAFQPSNSNLLAA